jgi:hypothetical protein
MRQIKILEKMKGRSFKDIAHETNKDLGKVRSITDMAREAVCYYILSNSERIGCSSKIVETDESLF